MTSAHLIATARGYIGTRFHHQGRLKKTGNHRGGIDCLGLLAGVARELDLRGKNGKALCDFDVQDYPHQPDALELRRRLETLLYSIPIADIAPGDIALFAIDGMAQHMGIICHPAGREASAQDLMPTDGDSALLLRKPQNDGTLGILHAYAPARAVVEHALDDYWQSKLVAAFRLPLLNH